MPALIALPRTAAQPKPVAADTVGRWTAVQASVALVAVATAARLAIAAWVGLGYGEGYHFSYALRPALSYFEHPPLAFWLAHLSMGALGAGPLAARLPTVLLFAGSCWLMHSITARAYGGRAAFFAVAVLNVSAVFTLSVGVFLQPDGPLVFCWLAVVRVLQGLFFPNDADVLRPPAGGSGGSGGSQSRQGNRGPQEADCRANGEPLSRTRANDAKGRTGPRRPPSLWRNVLSCPFSLWESVHSCSLSLWERVRVLSDRAGDWTPHPACGHLLPERAGTGRAEPRGIGASGLQGPPHRPTNGGETARWLLAGLLLGLAVLSKFHTILLVAGTLLFVVSVPRQRRWLTRPGPYLAVLLTGVASLPVLAWNWQHDWISFTWQGGRAGEYAGLRWDWLARNVGGQALWLLPWIWAPLTLELLAGLRHGRRRESDWLFVTLAVLPIGLFTAVSLYAPVGFHFHWQAPGYLMLFPLLGRTIDRRWSAGGRVTRVWLVASALVTVVALTALVTHTATGWWRDVGPQWLGSRFGEDDDPTLEALDWTELAPALEELGVTGEDVFVFTNRWFQSGKVDYALRGRLPVTCLGDDPRGYAVSDRSARWLGKDGILVGTDRFLADPQATYGGHFAAVEPLADVPVRRGGRVERVLRLYRCRDYRTPWTMPY